MRQLIMVALLTLCCTAVALADGDTSMRKMKGPEVAAFNTLQTSVKAALPRTLPNYSATFSGFDLTEVPEYLTPDQMASMQFKARYTLNAGVSEAGQRGALEDMMKGSPEQQARRAALNEKAEALKKARKSARSQGEKDRIKAELKIISAEESAIDEQIMASLQANLSMGAAGSAIQNITNAAPAKELSIQVMVNKSVDIYDIAQPYLLPGASLTFVQNEHCPDGASYCITALLGNFDKTRPTEVSTRYTPKNAKLGTPTKVRGMAVVVIGDRDKPESAKDLLQKIDLAKLKALLP
jgi:hypothetical protein